MDEGVGGIAKDDVGGERNEIVVRIGKRVWQGCTR